MQRIGMDGHWSTSTLSILDENGKEIKAPRINGHFEKVEDWIKKNVDGPFEIAFEASCGYGFVYDRLSKLADRVVVAHPGKLRLIYQNKRKNDLADARILAKLLYMDLLPTAYVPSIEIRDWRSLIEFRQRMVAQVVRTKNTLRALLRKQGIVAPKSLWSRKGLAWLAEVAMSVVHDFTRRTLLSELTVHRQHLKELTKHLDEIAARSPSVALLRTIRGIGPRTAEAMAAYIADPHRFRKSRQAGAYFGLVPCQDASAGTNRLGRITRDGPATARKLLVEASWQVIAREPGMKERFERLCRGQKDRRKKALIAVARHLVCCMVAMLQSGEPWRGSDAACA